MTSIPTLGQKVLLLWDTHVKKEFLIETVEKLRHIVGDNGVVALENLERLSVSDHASSSFDVVFCGTLTPTATFYPAEIFAEIGRILRPGGTVIIRESVAVQDNNAPQLRTAGKLASALRLSGFVNISPPETIPITKDNVEEYEKIFRQEKDVTLIEIKAYKPNFEVGASVPLENSKKNVLALNKPSSEVAKIWMLSSDDTLDENVELINEDDLLDESDLKKPDPSSLRVCATTKKRKACKNCSCGLAEELEAEASEKIEKNKSASSACGSCYLGDAFRCESCPYLGMPAFKPGEKIILSDRQLKADE